MIPEVLFDSAFAFRKSKLWQKLCDSQLFAVRHSDGTLGYCCVMGMIGEHIALAVYPGDAGLDSYRRMCVNCSDMDVFDEHEVMTAQDCLMVSFQNKSELFLSEVEEINAYTASHGLTLRGKKSFPQFERFCPHYVPWRLDDETDQTHLLEALEAALEVSNRLMLTAPETIGFTEGKPFNRLIPLLEKENNAFVWKTIELGAVREQTYASPEINDELMLAKLAKCKKNGGEWACDIFLHIDPISEEVESGKAAADCIFAPYFPYVLLITDNKTGMALGVQTVKGLDDVSEFARYLIDIVQRIGKPLKILVYNQRAYAFFKNIAPALDAKLVMKEQIPFLIEARESFAEQFEEMDKTGENDVEDMIAILSNPEVYYDMPDEVLLMLTQVAESGSLCDEVVSLIRRECKKRGIR